MYKICDANKLAKPEEGKPLTPKDYKASSSSSGCGSRVDLSMSQNSECGCLPGANAMLVKFAEKQMPRKFEVFMYNNYVIHGDTVNSLRTAL